MCATLLWRRFVLYLKTMKFVSKKSKVCVKNDELCIKNDQRLVAESTIDHSTTVGGPRYQMVTAEGQFYISSGVPGPRANVPGLAERLQAMYPEFAVGIGGDSPNDHFIVRFLIGNEDSSMILQ